MTEIKLVTRNIRINGIHHKASDMPEEEIKKSRRLRRKQEDKHK